MIMTLIIAACVGESTETVTAPTLRSTLVLSESASAALVAPADIVGDPPYLSCASAKIGQSAASALILSLDELEKGNDCAFSPLIVNVTSCIPPVKDDVPYVLVPEGADLVALATGSVAGVRSALVTPGEGSSVSWAADANLWVNGIESSIPALIVSPVEGSLTFPATDLACDDGEVTAP